VDFGMSDLGPVYFGPMMENTEWGRAIFEPTKVSDAVQAKVDEQVQKFLTDAQKLARKVLEKYKKELDRVSDELVEKETLDGDQFEKVVGKPKVKIVVKYTNKK